MFGCGRKNHFKLQRLIKYEMKDNNIYLVSENQKMQNCKKE